jgi:acyl-CoA reductase-like NAD-dependent aldehyde dehydrogenase
MVQPAVDEWRADVTETVSGSEIRTGLYIAGAQEDAAESFAVHDPADPDLVVGHAGAAGEEQARRAVAAAHDAFPAWAALGAEERAARVRASLGALAADNDERVELLSRENGKVRSECEIEMHVIEARFELAAGLADVVAGVRELPAPPYRTQVMHLPLGVVSLIVPFNWPLAILAASLPQALVAGNTVVVKAPPTTPLSFVRTVALIAAELPPGVVNVVSGHDAVLGPVLIGDPRVRKVCFTGSVGGGKRIMAMAADSLTRVTLELGGNDPALVLADADLTEETIGKLFVGAFLTTGQVCMAMKRLYVHRSHYDAVVEGLTGALGGQRLGPGLDPGATMGPLNSARQREFVTGLLDEVRGTAEVRELGKAVDDAAVARGHFLRPSLVLDPSPGARVVTEEQFGPTLPVIPFDDEQAAIAQANDTWSGLCSSVWSSDPEHTARVAAQLRTGTTFVNAHNAPWLDERAPFGGFNQSGMGREMGEEGILAFTDTHSVSYPG